MQSRFFLFLKKSDFFLPKIKLKCNFLIFVIQGDQYGAWRSMFTNPTFFNFDSAAISLQSNQTSFEGAILLQATLHCRQWELPKLFENFTNSPWLGSIEIITIQMFSLTRPSWPGHPSSCVVCHFVCFVLSRPNAIYFEASHWS